MPETNTPSVTLNWRSVGLPAEHGGWGFLLEPLLLGLLLAPTWQGGLFSLAIVALFLLHQPLKITAKDYLKRKRNFRTQFAEKFIFAYGSIAFVAFLLIAGYFTVVQVVLFVSLLGLALIQAFYDFRNQSRAFVPEIAGAISLSLSAPIILFFNGMAWQLATTIWLILALRAVISIVYVRARLRLQKDKPVAKLPSIIVHGIALIAVIVLWITEFLPLLTVLIFGLLLFRAWDGLYRQPPVSAKVIGFTELALGIALALATALGIYWQI